MDFTVKNVFMAIDINVSRVKRTIYLSKVGRIWL